MQLKNMFLYAPICRRIRKTHVCRLQNNNFSEIYYDISLSGNETGIGMDLAKT